MGAGEGRKGRLKGVEVEQLADRYPCCHFGSRLQHRRHRGIPPQRRAGPPHLPPLPGISSVRAASLTGETPRQGRELTSGSTQSGVEIPLSTSGGHSVSNREARLATPRGVRIVRHPG